MYIIYLYDELTTEIAFDDVYMHAYLLFENLKTLHVYISYIYSLVYQ